MPVANGDVRGLDLERLVSGVDKIPGTEESAEVRFTLPPTTRTTYEGHAEAREDTEACGHIVRVHFAFAWSTVLVSVRVAVKAPEASSLPETVEGTTEPPTVGICCDPVEPWTVRTA
jgi:hypothetical protein